MDRFDYRGAFHVHSCYSSDAEGDVEEIMAAANDAGLDFVLLTDHDTLQAAEDGHEKWHGSCLLIVGAEVTPSQNHYIVVGHGALEGLDTLKDRPTQEIIDTVRKAGWFGSIAHPKFTVPEKYGGGTYSWTDWSVHSVGGIAIWNLLADWNRALESGKADPVEMAENLPAWLTGPDPEVLKRWDELLKKGRVSGIGEVDNHRQLKRYGGVEIPVFPHEKAFRTITNHVLLEEPLARQPARAKEQVVTALARGRSFVVLENEEDASEFSLIVEHDEGTAGPGDEFQAGEEDELFVSLPIEANIRLIRNGEIAREVHSFEMVSRLPGPGVYRVEVRLGDRPWIFSNPVYSRPATPSHR